MASEPVTLHRGITRTVFPCLAGGAFLIAGCGDSKDGGERKAATSHEWNTTEWATTRGGNGLQGRVLDPVPLNPQVKWTFAAKGAVTTEAAVARGVIVFGDDEGIVYAVDLETRRERWRIATKDTVEATPAILPEEFRDACWRELATRVREADALVSPSGFYADLMKKRLGPEALDVTVLPNGISLEGHTPVTERSGPPAIGFLARMCREKGLDIMVEAFIRLRNNLAHPDARLVLTGAATVEDQPLIASLRQRLEHAGLAEHVQWRTNVSRDGKTSLLRSLTLFSVPAVYPEAFGLYVLEAMASGVPVVQPDAAAFPEIVNASGAGVLVPAGCPAALAQACHDLLQQPGELRRMAETSRRAAEEIHDISVMRDGFLSIAQKTAVVLKRARDLP